jgi:putative DNA primase/helicase
VRESYATRPYASTRNDRAAVADSDTLVSTFKALLDSQPRRDLKSEADAWLQHSDALAAWSLKHLVNRTDAWGKYKTNGGQYTAKNGELSAGMLDAHFRATSSGPIMGLHAIGWGPEPADGEPRQTLSRWGLIDIDRHEEGDDPDANVRYACLLHDRARELGFDPLLYDSDGRGGFHLVLVFAEPAPSSHVYHFMKWLTRDFADHGVKKVETFPKQEKITVAHPYGNWVRLPGCHHKRRHYTRVWTGSAWLAGSDAIRKIVSTTGAAPSVMPAEAIAPAAKKVEPPRPRKKQTDLLTDLAHATEAIRFLGAEYVDDYHKWLNVGFALRSLGPSGLSLWDTWSRSSNKYKHGDCEAKWSTMTTGEGGVNLGSLFHWAENSGWVPPWKAPRSPEGGGGAKRKSTNGRHERNGSGGGVAPPPQTEAEGGGAVQPNEAVDDPSRLARLFLHEHFTHDNGLTLRYWRGEWHLWDGAYRPVLTEDIRARLHSAIKREFDRENVEAIERWQRENGAEAGAGHDNGPKGPPKARKVTGALVANAALALSDYTHLDPLAEPPAWLGGDGPFPAHEALPTRNALVYLPGLVDGDPRAIQPPTPAYFCAHCLGYDFNPEAPRPDRWLAFVDSLWPDDPESVSALQEWMGHLLTPDTRHQKILMMIGPRRSGKGTIARVIRGVIGEKNVANPTLAGLATNFGLAPLIGKPAAIVTDARLSARTDIAQVVERLLSISGEDAQTIDRKHLPAVTVKLPTRFTLISNELPRLADTSGALAGRLILLRLTKSFYGREDHELTADLMTELPGILLWAIEGWRRLRERGRFVQPTTGTALVEEVEDLASPVGAFLKDRCVIEPGADVMVKDLFESWRSWCQERGRDNTGDTMRFGRDLRAVLPNLNCVQRRTRDGRVERFYEGIGFKAGDI